MERDNVDNVRVERQPATSKLAWWEKATVVAARDVIMSSQLNVCTNHCYDIHEIPPYVAAMLRDGDYCLRAESALCVGVSTEIKQLDIVTHKECV